MAPEGFHERRKYPRVKTEIPLELRHAGSAAPLRAMTTEISYGGCYIETMFTLEVGTKLDMVMWLDDERVSATGVIATRYPQVGNGIDIVEMSAADHAKLASFLAKQEVSRPGVF